MMNSGYRTPLLLFVLLFSVSSGWLYVDYSGSALKYDFYLRAIIICTTCLITFLGYLFVNGPNFKNPFFIYLFALYVIYTFLLVVARGDFFSGISPSIRFITLYFFFVLSMRTCYKKNIFILRTFSLWVVIEGLLSLHFFEAGIFINGMWRLGGPIGSASGYAALLFLVNLASLFTWSCKYEPKSLSFLLYFFSFYLLFATGSRSVLFFTGLFSVTFLLLYFRIGMKIISLSLVTLLSPFLLEIFTKSQIYKRIGHLIIGNDDNSLGYREYISETYFENISTIELFFGLGLNGFPKWFEGISGDSGVAPHMELLTILIEGGVIGSVFFLFACLSLILYLKKHNSFGRHFHIRWLSLFIFSAPLVAFIALNPTYFIGPMLVWVLFVVILIKYIQGESSEYESNAI
jgi:hypothetical protein